MTLEEIQKLSDIELLNALLVAGHKLLDASAVEDETLHQLKDMKREVLFRMHYGSRGKSTFSANEDGDRELL